MAVEFLPGNRLTLLRSGVEYFPALEAAIREAQREIFLETYIYAGDATGRRITRALCEAASRGAAVHVLVDGFGAKDMPEEFVSELRDAGARLLVFRPEVWRFPFRRDRLRRMHRKIVVADGRVAFVGGINIIDDLDTPRQKPPRYDYAVKIEGPLLGPIQDSAVRLWNRIALARLQHAWRVSHPVPPRLARAGSQRAALAVRDNLRHRRDIEDAYLVAIGSAQEEVVIASAYFFPGRRFRRALTGAAARGVRVVLLLQGRVEYVLLHYASRALYGTLLEAGVEIYEYQKSFMHAKVAVIDGHWATVGSSNIDPFSLLLAREANVVVEDRRFAAELRSRLRADIEHGARVVAKTRWFRQPLWKRVPNWVGYGVARFAIGMFGFGGRF
ncbi:MAG: cardiolipin synthase ClsB [Betaproteobacteria bacterium]|nr:MAG: cardiolipin synthase ClsB [Betaproteobacteria bacterium]TMH81361.1 MAG: cardiolipin synthase ClsB [Betaproteobacteria bacterium]